MVMFQELRAEIPARSGGGEGCRGDAGRSSRTPGSGISVPIGYRNADGEVPGGLKTMKRGGEAAMEGCWRSKPRLTWIRPHVVRGT